MIAEIVGPSGRIHYRRPTDDPLVAEAQDTPGYTVRIVKEETVERPAIELCLGCNREIDRRRLADCHPLGTPGCVFSTVSPFDRS